MNPLLKLLAITHLTLFILTISYPNITLIPFLIIWISLMITDLIITYNESKIER